MTLRKAAASKQSDDSVAQAMEDAYTSIIKAASVSEDFANEFDTFVTALGGDVAVIASFDGSIGYALKTGNRNLRFLAEVGVGLGADLDVDLGENIGFSRLSPHDMKGSFFAVQVGGDEIAGGGVAVLFEFPSGHLLGFRFTVSTGEGVEAGAMMGYTMTWK